MSEEISPPEALRSVSWSEAFSEGEKRITQKWVNALVKTPAEDRVRLLAARESIQKKIARALEKNDSKKLRAAFRAQINPQNRMILSRIIYFLENNSFIMKMN